MIELGRNLTRYRDLLWSLAVKDTQIKYKQSLMGIAWAIFQPLSIMLVFSLVFSRFLQIKVQTEIPYPVFLYSALVPWTFFATGLTFAIPSLVQNLNLVTKTAFPREMLPIAAILASALDFLMAWAVLMLLLLYYQMPLTPWLLLTPVLLVLQVLLMVGISLLASAANVFYRDVKYTITLGLFLWMFMTPVVFSLDQIPASMRPLMLLNPIAGVVDSFRRITALGVAPDPTALASSALAAVVLCWVGYAVFKRYERQFGDII